MFTQEEKKLLLDLLNSAQFSGNRETVQKLMERLDILARKIEAMPTEPAEEVSSQPSAKKPVKK